MSLTEISKKEYDIRLNICNDCPVFDKSMSVCTSCGCGMILKSKWQESTCPENKW